jgi:hypothetical protein
VSENTDAMAVLRELVDAHEKYAHYRSRDSYEAFQRIRDRYIAAWQSAKALTDAYKPKEGK